MIALLCICARGRGIVRKFLDIGVVVVVLIGLVGCESSSSFSKKTSKEAETDETTVVSEKSSDNSVPEIAPELVEEAEEKYELASHLLVFAGPIDELSFESSNVRWLAADVLQAAIDLNPTEFKYYRDLFMTYMALLEPVKAVEVLEPALESPVLAAEAEEFQSLVFGALEYAAIVDPDE